MKKIALIGCGTIGKEIALAFENKVINGELAALYDVNHEKAQEPKEILKTNSPVITREMKQAVSIADFIIETASQKAVIEISKYAFSRKKDIFILSVGSLVTYPDIFKRAKQ